MGSGEAPCLEDRGVNNLIKTGVAYAAAREWLAEREAELLPVPYFQLVFTLPARIADIAYQNKAVIYDLLFKASSETLLTIAADPKHLGARIGINGSPDRAGGFFRTTQKDAVPVAAASFLATKGQYCGQLPK